MATNGARKKGKTVFVKEVLGKNPYANATTVNEAWKEAGRDGTISATLVNKQRSALGFAGNLRSSSTNKAQSYSIVKPPYTGKKRGRKPKNFMADNGTLARSQTNGRNAELPAHTVESGARATRYRGALEELEADIDRLLFRVMALGNMPAVEESLRQTRRLLYAVMTVKGPRISPP